MTEGPAEKLARVWDHADYYAAMGTTVTFDTERDEGFEFEVAEVEYGCDSPRRFFVVGLERLWVDSESEGGEITDTTPWLDVTHTKPDPVTAVRIEKEVSE